MGTASPLSNTTSNVNGGATAINHPRRTAGLSPVDRMRIRSMQIVRKLTKEDPCSGAIEAADSRGCFSPDEPFYGNVWNLDRPREDAKASPLRGHHGCRLRSRRESPGDFGEGLSSAAVDGRSVRRTPTGVQIRIKSVRGPIFQRERGLGSRSAPSRSGGCVDRNQAGPNADGDG